MREGERRESVGASLDLRRFAIAAQASFNKRIRKSFLQLLLMIDLVERGQDVYDLIRGKEQLPLH